MKATSSSSSRKVHSVSRPDFTAVTAAHEPFLRSMLWVAANWRTPDPPPPDVVLAPELSRYTDDFGRRGDHGYIAMYEDEPVAAAWCRLLTAPDGGYGYVADDVPELSVAVLPQCRGQGIGTGLIERLLSDVAVHHRAISLSVEPDNPARLLYERLGFASVSEHGGSWTMSKPL